VESRGRRLSRLELVARSLTLYERARLVEIRILFEAVLGRRGAGLSMCFYRCSLHTIL